MSNQSRVAAVLKEKMEERERVQKEIDEAVRKVELISAQIAVLRDVLPEEAAKSTLTAPPPLAPVGAPLAPERPKKRGRRGVWRDILARTAAEFFSEFTTDDMLAVARRMGVEPPRSTIRTQAANYVANGWLRRIEKGRFVFTEEGRKELGLISNSPPAASAPAVSVPPPPPPLPQSKESETDETRVEDLV